MTETDIRLDDERVALSCDPLMTYGGEAPYAPDEAYPEVEFAYRDGVSTTNKVYGAVRRLLASLGRDVQGMGTTAWNPLRGIVKPDDRVVICPNAVMDYNQNPTESVFACITHGSVIRCVVDYVYKALEGRGSITVASAPLMHCDFDHWSRLSGLVAIRDYYAKHVGFALSVLDLRADYAPWDRTRGYATRAGRREVCGDPAGYRDVDLGSASEFAGWNEASIRRLYGADYDRSVTCSNHSGGAHRYRVSGTVLGSDVFIAVPKLKVHMKVGLTVNLKGMVGTQCDKNFIPHFRKGPPRRGGDEYPNCGWPQELLNDVRMWLSERLLVRDGCGRDTAYRITSAMQRSAQTGWDRLQRWRYADFPGNNTGGSWYGNDTAWRMTLDLTRIALYADANGVIRDVPQRRFFSVVDGVMAGEGEGPLSPTAKPCGALLAGSNPLAVDLVCARLMGFDAAKIPMLREALCRDWLACWAGGRDSVRVTPVHGGETSVDLAIPQGGLRFIPSKGWKGHIEAEPRAEGTTREDRSL